MIKSIPFSMGHMDLLRLSDVHSDDATLIDDYKSGGVSSTFIETIIEDQKLMVMGVMNGILINSKCMEVCMMVGDNADLNPIGFTRHVRRSIDRYNTELGLSRVQCTIRDGFPHLIKWMKVLGFKKESTLERWGPTGENYSLYARFFNHVG